MAVTVVGSDKTHGTGSSGTTTFTVPIPTVADGGVKADDQLEVIFTQRGGAAASIATPTGWVSIRRTDNGNNVAVHSFRRTAVGGETGTQSFTHTTTATMRWSATVRVLRGVNPQTPVNVSDGATAGAVTTATAPTVTTTVDGCFVGRYYGQRVDSTATLTWTPGAGLTETIEEGTPGLATANVSGATGHDTADQTAAGATGTRDATLSGTPQTVVAQTIAWAPTAITVTSAQPAGVSSASSSGTATASATSAQPAGTTAATATADAATATVASVQPAGTTAATVTTPDPVVIAGTQPAGITSAIVTVGPALPRPGRPAVRPLTELIYTLLPEHYREVDRANTDDPPGGYPLLRYISLAGDQADEVTALAERIDPDLTDVETAENRWLAWLAQHIGLRAGDSTGVADSYARLLVDFAGYSDVGAEYTTYEALRQHGLSVPGGATSPGELRERLRHPETVFLATARAGYRALLAPYLTGAKRVEFSPHFGGDRWHLRLETYARETPRAAVIEALLQRYEHTAGLTVTYAERTGSSYGQVLRDFGSYSAVRSHFATYTTLAAYDPEV